MDDDTRKIMTVIAAFDEEHQRLKIAIAALMKVTGQISGDIKGGAREAVAEALTTLHPPIDRAHQTLSALQRFSLWRAAWQNATVAAVAILVTLAAVWWYVPSLSEMTALRAEHEQLQASIEDLNNRGAKIKTIGCGPQKRLCVLVDRTGGTFGVAGNKEDVYMIIKGY